MGLCICFWWQEWFCCQNMLGYPCWHMPGGRGRPEMLSAPGKGGTVHRPHFPILRAPHPLSVLTVPVPKCWLVLSVEFLIPKLALAPHGVTQGWLRLGDWTGWGHQPGQGRRGCFPTPHTRFGAKSKRLGIPVIPGLNARACLPHPQSPGQTHPPLCSTPLSAAYSSLTRWGTAASWGRVTRTRVEAVEVGQGTRF